MNPRIFSAFKYNKMIKKYSFEKWHEDKQKIQFAKDKGFEVKVVWASDYQKNKKEILTECKDFLFGS